MINKFEFADIDWSNQDINEVVDFFTKKFNIQEKEITRLGINLHKRMM